MVPVVPLVWLALYLWNRSRGGQQPPLASTSFIDGEEAVKGLVAIAGWCVVLLGFFQTLPLSVPWRLTLAVYLGVYAPHHLAWGPCWRLGWRKTGRALLWIAPHWRVGRRQGRLLLYDASLGRVPAALLAQDKKAVFVDAWTVCTAVLVSESAGSTREAAELVQGLLVTRTGPCLGRAVRGRAIEEIARAAAERGDWAEVARRASLGRGRGSRFLRLVARAHLVGDVSPAMLRAAWLLAPRRRRGRALLDAALTAGQPLHERRTDVADGDPWRRHLLLLDAAARGARLDLAAVAEAARAWDAQLTPVEEAHFRARALELGSLRSAETLEQLRDSLLTDLASVSGVALGPWPEGAAGGRLSGALQGRLLDEVHAAVARHGRNGDSKPKAEMGGPFEEWRTWLHFRAALLRLGERFGEDALRTAWYGGAQLVAWNWPCRLLEVHGAKAAWACHMMFQWTAETARRCEDKEAARVNEKNVAVALQQVRVA